MIKFPCTSLRLSLITEAEEFLSFILSFFIDVYDVHVLSCV